jgi:hypothetical protein
MSRALVAATCVVGAVGIFAIPAGAAQINFSQQVEGRISVDTSVEQRSTLVNLQKAIEADKALLASEQAGLTALKKAIADGDFALPHDLAAVVKSIVALSKTDADQAYHVFIAKCFKYRGKKQVQGEPFWAVEPAFTQAVFKKLDANTRRHWDSLTGFRRCATVECRNEPVSAAHLAEIRNAEDNVLAALRDRKAVAGATAAKTQATRVRDSAIRTELESARTKVQGDLRFIGEKLARLTGQVGSGQNSNNDDSVAVELGKAMKEKEALEKRLKELNERLDKGILY